MVTFHPSPNLLLRIPARNYIPEELMPHSSFAFISISAASIDGLWAVVDALNPRFLHGSFTVKRKSAVFLAQKQGRSAPFTLFSRHLSLIGVLFSRRIVAATGVHSSFTCEDHTWKLKAKETLQTGLSHPVQFRGSSTRIMARK